MCSFSLECELQNPLHFATKIKRERKIESSISPGSSTWLSLFLLRDQVLHTNVGARNHNYLNTRDHFLPPLSQLSILCLPLQILSLPSPPFSVPQDICGPHQQAPFPSGFQAASASGRRSEGKRGKGLVFPALAPDVWRCGCHLAGKTTGLAKQPCPSWFFSQLSSGSFIPKSGSSPRMFPQLFGFP